MHGHQETSQAPRLTAATIHASAIGFAAWIYLRDGQLSLRDALLLGCSALYLARVLFGTFVLLKRRFDWSEAAMVSTLFAGLHISFAYLAASHTAPIGIFDIVAVALYVFGSYLNTGSEYSRHVWKKDPAHKGKLYSEGLFRHSMHINYFGDSLLFTGFAFLTGSVWAFIVPALMTLGFVFQHIPTLDAYLAERYGAQFEDYAQKTKKFIPYIY